MVGRLAQIIRDFKNAINSHWLWGQHHSDILSDQSVAAFILDYKTKHHPSSMQMKMGGLPHCQPSLWWSKDNLTEVGKESKLP